MTTVKPWCCRHKLTLIYIAAMSTVAAATGIADVLWWS